MGGTACGAHGLSTLVDIDSDLDVDMEVPMLDSVVDAHTITHLKPNQRKQQEILNG